MRADTQLILPSELAKELRVGEDTISRWKIAGVITAEINEGKVVRYNLANVKAALAERAKKGVAQ